jgi:hypothetical protein
MADGASAETICKEQHFVFHDRERNQSEGMPYESAMAACFSLVEERMRKTAFPEKMSLIVLDTLSHSQMFFRAPSRELTERYPEESGWASAEQAYFV